MYTYSLHNYVATILSDQLLSSLGQKLYVMDIANYMCLIGGGKYQSSFIYPQWRIVQILA